MDVPEEGVGVDVWIGTVVHEAVMDSEGVKVDVKTKVRVAVGVWVWVWI
jgi:hypothetical protein